MRLDAGTLSADTLERVGSLCRVPLLSFVTFRSKVKQLVRKDAMYPLTSSDLISIWKARLHLKNVEEALPKVWLLSAASFFKCQHSLLYH